MTDHDDTRNPPPVASIPAHNPAQSDSLEAMMKRLLDSHASLERQVREGREEHAQLRTQLEQERGTARQERRSAVHQRATPRTPAPAASLSAAALGAASLAAAPLGALLATPVSSYVQRQLAIEARVGAQRSLVLDPPAPRDDEPGSGSPSSGSADSGAEDERPPQQQMHDRSHRKRSGPGRDGLSWKEIMNLAPKQVETFYGNSARDKERTVMQYLSDLNQCAQRLLRSADDPYVVEIVKLTTGDNARQHVQDKEQLIAEAGQRSGRDFRTEPLSWRNEFLEEFVERHIGTDLPEVWLQQLKCLVLGKGKCKTPMDLDSQFDQLARRVYPRLNLHDMQEHIMLAETYGNCVANGNQALYDRITEIHSPTTLRDWKIALAKQWAAEEKKRLRAAAQRSDRPAYQRGGGYAAQKTATLHAVSEEGVQGEPHTDEGADDSKQSLAAVGSGRGGRGGRGHGGRGRGRGGGESGGMPSNLTEEQQKWWKEGLCLKCGQSGHRARGCLKA